MQQHRREFLAAAGGAGLFALAGCLGGVDSGSAETPDSGGSGGSGPPTAAESLPLPMEGSALRENVKSGGPPKDGIPAIEEPTFEPADAVGDRLAPGDVVFGLVRNGVAKAYPQSILVWHEIANDEIGGEPISVTYCPLTGTVLGFERGDTTFGVSGRLVNNNLIMYDRATERWWPQVLGTSIPGPWYDGETGQSLRDFRLVWTTWERWRDEHPDTKVLTEDTGAARNYDDDPYGQYNPVKGYYRTNADPLFPALHRDDRYAPKRVVLGARSPEGAVAFLKDALRGEKLLEGDLGGTPVLGVYDPRLDTGYVYRNPDGASFEFTDGTVEGSGGAHAPDDLPLERVHAFDAMWFAWAGFYPETSVHE